MQLGRRRGAAGRIGPKAVRIGAVDDYLLALAFAALPAAGNFAGGLVAETFEISDRVLSLALHAALGILVAVIGLELMPEALAVEEPWVPVVAFVVGGGFFMAADRVIHTIEARFGDGEAAPWLVFFAVSVDLFSDGLMIGAGAVVGTTLALLLALGQVSADFPEGFATVAGFKRRGVPRSRRLLILAAFVVPVFVGTTIGFWAVRDAPEVVQLSLLAFTAGILLAVAIEEIGPQAHKKEPRTSALALVGGFALFALISAYVG